MRIYRFDTQFEGPILVTVNLNESHSLRSRLTRQRHAENKNWNNKKEDKNKSKPKMDHNETGTNK